MVRQAQPRDLSGVAEVHTACFPDSFSTALGKKLLEKFYREYLADVPELFLVAENDRGEPIGFCMGYYCEANSCMKRFLKRNFVAVGLRLLGMLLVGNRAAWKKVLGVFGPKPEFRLIDERFRILAKEDGGDLLSICVLEQHRGQGTAQALLDAYHRVLKERHRRYCLLSVDVNNPRGIRFYEKNGYTPFREVPGVARSYMRSLEGADS